MKKFIIKKAIRKDAFNLSKLDNIANKEFEIWSKQTRKDFEKSISSRMFVFLIAYLNDNPVGYIESEFDISKDIVWIKNIFLIQEFRKKGIAKKLISICSRYWKNKTNLLILLTADRNLKIFEKLGFKKTMNYMVKKI